MKRREVLYVPGAQEDLERLFEFLMEKDLEVAERALTTIRKTLEVAAGFPLMCRRSTHWRQCRECVIAFGKSGYVALFDVHDDFIRVLAIRHQREQDYD
jgi:plasmid stabilization system protein ParE